MKKVSIEILSSVDPESNWLPAPAKERDTRWMSNARSAKIMLQGWYIQDENGTPFWVLLAQRLIHIYKDSDWRVERLHAFIEWMLMHFLTNDVAFPFWRATFLNPEHGFPNTVKFIKEEMEEKGHTEMAEIATAQLKEGIQCAYDEMAKMYDPFFRAPWVFTVFGVH